MDQLPDECLENISKFLNLGDFIAMSRVNKSVRTATTSNQTAWFHQYQSWTHRFDRDQHKKVNYRRRLAHLLKKHLEKKYSDQRQRGWQGLALHSGNKIAVLINETEHLTEKRKRAWFTVENLDSQLSKKRKQMDEWTSRRERAKSQLWKDRPGVVGSNPHEYIQQTFVQFEPKPRIKRLPMK